MRIEHAALYVNDLEGARVFFETYFGAVPNDGYHNPKTGLRTYFLTFGNHRLGMASGDRAVAYSEGAGSRTRFYQVREPAARGPRYGRDVREMMQIEA